MGKSKRAPPGLPRREGKKRKTGLSTFTMALLLVPLLAYLVLAYGSAALLAARKLTYDAGSPTADHIGFGEVLLGAGDEAGARAAFIAAARFAPESAPALGAAASALAAYADATSSAAASSSTAASDDTARTAVNEARVVLEAALDADPSNARARAALPVLMRAVAGTTAEIETLLQALKQEQEDDGKPAVPTLNQLQIELKKVRGGYGRHAEAIAALYRAVDLVPRFDIGWFNLGQTLSALNRFEEQATAFRRVTAIAPSDWEAFEKLGEACREHGERGAVCGDGAAATAMAEAQKGGRTQVYLGRMQYRHGLALRRGVVSDAKAGSADATSLAARWDRSSTVLQAALVDYEARTPAEAGPFTTARVLTAVGDAPALKRAREMIGRWCSGERIRTAPPLPPLSEQPPPASPVALSERLATFAAGAEPRFAAFTCTALLAEVDEELESVESLAQRGRPNYEHAFDSDRLYRDGFMPSALKKLKAEAVAAVLGGGGGNITGDDGAMVTTAVKSTPTQALDIARRYSATAYAHLVTPLSVAEQAAGELEAATAERAYRQFEENGLVAFNGVLPAAEVRALRTFVDDVAFHQPAFPVASGIKNPALRFYPLLTIAQAQPLLGRIVRLLKPVLDAVVGENAALCELGVIVADPGSAGQIAHVDTAPRWDDLGPRQRQPGALISVFVALDDVAFEQGAFEAWPGSHRNYFNVDATFTSHHEEDGVRFAAPAGTIYAYTSSLVHRGRGNEHHKRRANFMFSVVRRDDAAGTGYTMPKGSTWALLPEYGTRDAGFSKSLGDLVG